MNSVTEGRGKSGQEKNHHRTPVVANSTEHSSNSGHNPKTEPQNCRLERNPGYSHPPADQHRSPRHDRDSQRPGRPRQGNDTHTEGRNRARTSEHTTELSHMPKEQTVQGNKEEICSIKMQHCCITPPLRKDKKSLT